MEGSKDYADELKDLLAKLEISDDYKTIMTLYIDDENIIADAKANNLSIGKQYLLMYAKLQNITLTADDIRDTTISALLTQLNVTGKDNKLVSTTKESASTTEATTEATTTEATTETTTLNVQVSQETGGVAVSWDKAPKAENFKYYKVVASKTDSTPSYPDNGY